MPGPHHWTVGGCHELARCEAGAMEGAGEGGATGGPGAGEGVQVELAGVRRQLLEDGHVIGGTHQPEKG